jgi:hypothetical protein
MLNGLRNHGFQQSADFRIFTENPSILDEFLQKFRIFHKKRRAFFLTGFNFRLF